MRSSSWGKPNIVDLAAIAVVAGIGILAYNMTSKLTYDGAITAGATYAIFRMALYIERSSVRVEERKRAREAKGMLPQIVAELRKMAATVIFYKQSGGYNFPDVVVLPQFFRLADDLGEPKMVEDIRAVYFKYTTFSVHEKIRHDVLSWELMDVADKIGHKLERWDRPWSYVKTLEEQAVLELNKAYPDEK